MAIVEIFVRNHLNMILSLVLFSGEMYSMKMIFHITFKIVFELLFLLWGKLYLYNHILSWESYPCQIRPVSVG